LKLVLQHLRCDHNYIPVIQPGNLHQPV